MQEERLGFRFWAWLAGVIVIGGLVALVVMLIFSRAIYAWGLLGGFLALAGLALLIGWFYDRRQVRRYGTETE